jgi:hypothetical protein
MYMYVMRLAMTYETQINKHLHCVEWMKVIPKNGEYVKKKDGRYWETALMPPDVVLRKLVRLAKTDLEGAIQNGEVSPDDPATMAAWIARGLDADVEGKSIAKPKEVVVLKEAQQVDIRGAVAETKKVQPVDPTEASPEVETKKVDEADKKAVTKDKDETEVEKS